MEKQTGLLDNPNTSNSLRQMPAAFVCMMQCSHFLGVCMSACACACVCVCLSFSLSFCVYSCLRVHWWILHLQVQFSMLVGLWVKLFKTYLWNCEMFQRCSSVPMSLLHILGRMCNANAHRIEQLYSLTGACFDPVGCILICFCPMFHIHTLLH